METDNTITEGQAKRWTLPDDKKATLEKQLSELFTKAGVEDKSKAIVRWFCITVNRWTEETLKLTQAKGISTIPELFNPEKVRSEHVMAAQFIGALVRVFNKPIKMAMEARKRIQAQRTEDDSGLSKE